MFTLRSSAFYDIFWRDARMFIAARCVSGEERVTFTMLDLLREQRLDVNITILLIIENHIITEHRQHRCIETIMMIYEARR